MAQVERLKEEKKGTRAQKRENGASPSRGNLTSFNPSDDQKKTIRGDERPLEDVMLSLETALQDGHRLTLQYNPDYDSYSVIVREGGVEWQSAVAISCWHRDVVVALRIMDYCLRFVYPDFPVGAYQRVLPSLDW